MHDDDMIARHAHRAGAHSVHAVLDLSTRQLKAQKILALLALPMDTGASLRLLEVGCGSGGIANYFGTLPGSPFVVEAVDIEDNRQVRDGYRFTRVDGVELPFADASFDAVLSNHVIEHVGDAQSQLGHLRELGRVMRPAGAGYLAVPNRWQLVEPHFRLPFLSWLPPAWRTAYVRVAGRGSKYDCRPLQRGELEGLFATAGLQFRNKCVDALRATLRIEQRGWRVERALLERVPDRWLWCLRSVCPTHVYCFGHHQI